MKIAFEYNQHIESWYLSDFCEFRVAVIGWTSFRLAEAYNKVWQFDNLKSWVLKLMFQDIKIVIFEMLEN